MSTIRAAVIGTGYLGRFHAQKYASEPACALVAVADTRAEAREALARELNTRGVADHRELLGQVDAVSIVTTTPAHHSIARDFLEAGAHVLVEKPITETPEQARDLIALAARKGLILQVGHLERFNPAIVAAEGRLERARFIECQRLAPFNDVPILFISAKDKVRIFKVIETALEVYDNRKRKVPTSKLNEVMLKAIESYHPPVVRGNSIKVKYVTQLPTVVPSFAFFCNYPDDIKTPYRNYLENKLREHFNFRGVPVRIFFRKK